MAVQLPLLSWVWALRSGKPQTPMPALFVFSSVSIPGHPLRCLFLVKTGKQPVKYEGGLSMYTVTFEHSSIVYTTFDHEDAIAFAVNQAMLLHDAYYIRKD
jgi:hypothetical protein